MATTEVKVPDIGEFENVEVIEVLVKEGDRVSEEQSLITVESDKASMEIPSSAAGVVKALKVKLGDKVSQGSVVLELEVEAQAGTKAGQGAPKPQGEQAPEQAAPKPAQSAARAAQDDAEAASPPPQQAAAQQTGSPAAEASTRPSAAGSRSPTASLVGNNRDDAVVKPHASPSVRKFARELGVDLSRVRGSGPKQRILHDDVREWVKGAVRQADASGAARATDGDAGAALGLLPWPKVDFAKFGPIETRPLARIRKISAANLHRNWVMIPHVTNHEEADITELEAFRVQLNREHEKQGTKVTMLAFLIKACVAALKKYPEINASLDGDALVLKGYYHVGFAADTENGLVVPVVRDADRKGVLELARETAELASKAREGKLQPSAMQGGTFTISSLGGIGGTAFTPIINAPEVAILGVSRSTMRPVWDGKAFQPRLMLPLSLSYDHRVVDGAAAARFNAYLSQLLADFRRAML
jgi:pyruvate dehydrogenase E2 component (dihydrolipoamide acetyltransferase)